METLNSNGYKLKIVINSNIPSTEALKNFQKKLYEFQQNVEPNQTEYSIESEQKIRPLN